MPITDGQITFEGTELSSLEPVPKQFRHLMQMIFQDPYASLNPRMTVYDTLAEPLLLHGLVRKADLDQAIRELMDNVGLARAFVRKYPHEFSGGQRQRIAIGRALATRPEFIVADEPVYGTRRDHSGANSRPAGRPHEGIRAHHALHLA